MVSGDSQKDQEFDVRIRKWKLKRGAISRKEIDQYLRDLPDASEKARPIATAAPWEEDGLPRRR